MLEELPPQQSASVTSVSNKEKGMCGKVKKHTVCGDDCTIIQRVNKLEGEQT